MRRAVDLGLLLLVCAAARGQSPASRDYWTGSFDVRNRLVSDVAGSEQVYRSVVNLGEGPRIFGADARYGNVTGRWVDEMIFSSSAWGGDPYNSARLEARKTNLYEFRLNYRNISYFNNLPSFANPLLGEGLLLSQRALDVTRRQIDVELELKPTALVSPFISLYRADGFGRGRTTFVSDGNSYPVDSVFDDRLTSIRAGAKIEPKHRKWSALLEQGRTAFGDDQRNAFDQGGNRGNRLRPYFGQTLELDQLSQDYQAAGSGLVERGVFRARPWRRLSLTAQFVYSQPTIDVRQNLQASGVFVDQASLRLFSFLDEQSLGDANRPHSTASWGVELRLTSRLRVVQNGYSDRYHVSAGSSLTQLLNSSPEQTIFESDVNGLVFRYNHTQTDVIFDWTRHVSLRGGHRYVWGDAQTREPSLSFAPQRREGEIRRHTALAGAHMRASSRLDFSLDFEASPGDETFFRSGLMQYQRGKARARYRLRERLTLSGSFAVLNNRNPDPDVDFDFRRQAASVTVQWTSPGGRVTLLGDYTRATLRSDIRTIEPPFFAAGLSQYRDNGHLASGLVEVLLPHQVELNLGGGLSTNSGSRPSDFYQPRASLSGPLRERIQWIAEWRWYGFREEFLRLEDFRAHSVSAGLTASF